MSQKINVSRRRCHLLVSEGLVDSLFFFEFGLVYPIETAACVWNPGLFSLFWSFWCSPFSTNVRQDIHRIIFCPNETQARVLWNLFTSSISVGRNSFSVRPKCDASKIITLKKEILMHLGRVSSQDNQFWWIKPWLNLYSWQNQNWSCLDSHQKHWPIKVI